MTFILELHTLKEEYCQKYSMKCIYSTSQMLKLSLTLYTFNTTGLVAVSGIVHTGGESLWDRLRDVQEWIAILFENAIKTAEVDIEV